MRHLEPAITFTNIMTTSYPRWLYAEVDLDSSDHPVETGDTLTVRFVQPDSSVLEAIVVVN